MSGHGHGYGFGVGQHSAGDGGLVDPSVLSGLVHYWNGYDGSVTLMGVTPERVSDFKQMASGGSETTRLDDGNRPYYFTEDFVLDSAATGPQTIIAPNGTPFWGAQSGLDSDYLNLTSFRQNVDVPYTPKAGMSAIWTFFMHSEAFFNDNRRMMTGSGDQYFEFDAHGNIRLYDSGSYFYPRDLYAAKAWADAWHVLTWTWAPNSFKFALDGVEVLNEDDMTGSSAVAYLSQMPSGATPNTFMSHYIVYDTAHTLEDLDVVASGVARDTAISYSYTPLP